MERSNII